MTVARFLLAKGRMTFETGGAHVEDFEFDTTILGGVDRVRDAVSTTWCRIVNKWWIEFSMWVAM